MERLYPALIIDALKNVRYPGNGKNIVELNMVEDDIRIDGNKVSFSLIFEKPTMRTTSVSSLKMSNIP